MSADAQIIAERIAEVVNKKMSMIEGRIKTMEERISKNELDIAVLRKDTIESIVRSILTLKMEELTSGIAYKISSEFIDTISKPLENVNTTLSALLKLPEEVKEAVQQATKEYEKIGNRISEVSTRINELSKNINDKMSSQVSALQSSITSLEKSITKLNETITKMSEEIHDMRKEIERIEYSVKNVENTILMELRESKKLEKSISTQTIPQPRPGEES